MGMVQLLAEGERWIRSLLHLRTQNAERGVFEMEPAPPTDTRRKEPVRVRTQANFGNKKEKRASQSQKKLLHLRTQKGEKSQSESEPRPPSDIKREKSQLVSEPSCTIHKHPQTTSCKVKRPWNKLQSLFTQASCQTPANPAIKILRTITILR